jgi:glycosyltransferase involved in cell wall biosynthesis
MQNSPKVSVCMITYNHEKYIREAIDGVLMQQTDFPIELILANDCSTDSTDSVIQNILAMHPKANYIRYFHHPKNLGMMPNFIFALGQCQGKYIALCEGDDYWTDPLKLQKQVDFLENHKDFVACFHNVWMEDERTSNPTKVLWRSYDKDEFDTYDTISPVSLFHTSSYVLRNQLKSFPIWFAKVFSGDMALLTIISRDGKLKLIDFPMSVYRKNETGVTNFTLNTTFHQQRIILLKYFHNFLPAEFHQKIKQVMKYHKIKCMELKYPNIFNIARTVKKILK